MPEVVLTGAAGRIEGRYSPGKRETAPIALILHPHPRAGGSMNHPVAVQLYHLFMKRGFSTLRFNFRGVGRSQGEFDSGVGELADAATALDWGLVNTVVPVDQLEAETVRWCRDMLRMSPLALRLLKAGYNAGVDGLAGVQHLAGDATRDLVEG